MSYLKGRCRPIHRDLKEISKKTLELALPGPFGAAFARTRTQRTPELDAVPVAVMVPADSSANQMNDHELACKLISLADGSTKKGEER